MSFDRYFDLIRPAVIILTEPTILHCRPYVYQYAVLHVIKTNTSVRELLSSACTRRVTSEIRRGRTVFLNQKNLAGNYYS